jgi:excisionase family DNA binding protein
MNDIKDLLVEQGEKLEQIKSLLSSSKSVLNIAEVCMFTGLSKSHMYKLTCKGEIPYYKQAKHLYFDRVEIEAWLKTHRFRTNSELMSEAFDYSTKRENGNKHTK